MAKLLKKVQATEKGLIGLTTDNEEITLSAPLPRITIFCNDVSDNPTHEENYSAWFQNKVLSLLSKSSAEYLQIGEKESLTLGKGLIEHIAYNEFNHR